MALKKVFRTPEGYDAEYIRFDKVEEMSRTEKKICIYFSLYKDKEHADAGGAPARPIRLKLQGDKYDQYFGNSALSRELFIAQCYAAAKVERVDMWLGSGPGFSQSGQPVASPLAGAVDV